ncbi:SDR family oxidoreductase [Candidatus Woesebacteria bacterium]|nr:SDR family oxidoreductase [Candidatus Woesebacteria bacterium]
MKNTNWAIVTGASSGIGKEFAHIFAEHQVNLVIAARNENALISLADELTTKHKIKVLIYPTDLSIQSHVMDLVEFVGDNKITPEYLVNNAGFGDYGYFTETNWAKEEKMIDLNMKTLTYLTKIYAAEMKVRGSGKILNVASGAAFQPGPLMAIYFATKAYVLHFSEAIAEELSGTGVTVTALCPGPTESNFWHAAGKKNAISFVPGRIPSSRVVAEYGYEAMMRGKRVAIEGWRNRLLTFLVRFVPRNIVTKVIYRGQSTRK